jgi:putative peptide zinc metalloprotease protein
MPHAPTSAAGLNRRLALRRRHDLEAVAQTFIGRRYWAIKDPVRLRYFHLRDEEYCLFTVLDGTATLADLRDQFERQFAPRRLAVGQIQSFLGMLHREGLILSDAPGQTDELLKRADAARLRNLGATVSNVLAIRLRGIDPQRFLDWLSPKCRWLFSPASLLAGAVVVLAAVGLVVTRFDEVQSRFPDVNSLLTPATLIWLSVALALTKVLHELGHAVTCRHFGRACHELGVLFLVFTPCLYCNVSDSWMIDNKWQRAAIGAAGVFVELVLAGVCTFLWWFSEPGLFNSLCFNVMLVCSVSTLLFNGNPLMRYDGYFVLADLAEVPNLSQQAGNVLRDWIAAAALGIPAEGDDDHGPVGRFLLGLFAIASGLYRIVIMLGILWLLHNLLKPHRMEVLADALALVVAAGILAGPIWRNFKFIQHALWNRQMHPRRALTSGIIVCLCVAAGLLTPLPHRIAAPVVIEAAGARQVYVTVPGTIVETATAGDLVREAAPVAVLENLDLRLEIARLTGQRNEQKLRLDNLKRRQTNDAAASALIPTAEEALADLEERLLRRIADESRLVVKAPIAGTVLPVRRKPARYAAGELETWSGLALDGENRGSVLETGTLLCQIGDPQHFEASLVLDQRDVEFIRVGQAVQIQLEQSPGRTFTGTIREVAEIDLQVTPAELLPAGVVPTRVDEAGVQRPVSTAYQARVMLDKSAASLLIGEAGQAKIDAAPVSLANRIGRYLSHTFRFEM